MAIIERIRAMPTKKKMSAATVFCGIIGLLLILLSSVIPEKESGNELVNADIPKIDSSEKFREETEKRLEDFLEKIDGAGEVKVYLTVNCGERYVYAAEGRHSSSENRTEEERKYVMIGSGSEKNALVETVENPEIGGAVIACMGGNSAAVRERLYMAVSAALDIPSNKIYVTMLG